MKKFLQTSLVLALAAVGTQSVSAANCNNCRIYIEDFAIKAGETKYVYINVENPDYDFTAMQFDVWFKGGIVPVEKNGRVSVSRQSRVPEDGFAGSGAWQKEGDNERDHFRYLFYNAYGDYVEDTSGAILRLQVTTDDTFGKTSEQPAIVFGGELKLSDISDISEPHVLNPSTCNVYQAVALTDAATLSTDKLYAISAPITVAGQTAEIDADGSVYDFVTDGENWMKIKLNKSNANLLEEEVTYNGAQLIGAFRVENGNPVFVYDNNLGLTEASSKISANIQKIDMTSSLNMVSNQVVAVTAYFFDDDNQTTLRAYSGNNGERGQSLTLNNTWNKVSNNLVNGKPYTINKAAVQLKAAWETPAGAPALVAPSDENSFQNYVVYPLDVAQVATAITDITAKNVSSVRYYNVAGVEAATPFDGVNIVVTSYTDGTTSTAKVIK